MNERGYLYLLIGIGIRTGWYFGFIPQEIAIFTAFFIIMGVRELRTSNRELQSAFQFAIIALAINWSAFLGRRFVPELMIGTSLYIPLIVFEIFFDIGVFFWVLKAEYMWAPTKRSRIEWLGFTSVAAIYFLNVFMVTFSRFLQRFLPMGLLINLTNMLRPVSIVYYGVLVFIFAKLYLESRGNSPGLRRWN